MSGQEVLSEGERLTVRSVPVPRFGLGRQREGPAYTFQGLVSPRVNTEVQRMTPRQNKKLQGTPEGNVSSGCQREASAFRRTCLSFKAPPLTEEKTPEGSPRVREEFRRLKPARSQAEDTYIPRYRGPVRSYHRETPQCYYRAGTGLVCPVSVRRYFAAVYISHSVQEHVRPLS